MPGTRQRLDFPRRWPGVLEGCLAQQGHAVRVVENCLNGRRTAMPDPDKNGRDGRDGLAECIEAQSPLSWVLLMLGTNDFQSVHRCDPQDSVAGIERLMALIERAPIEPGMPRPDILLIAPPAIGALKGLMATKFDERSVHSRELSARYHELANARQCAFLDAGRWVQVSDIDGVHLDEPAHRVLGQAIATFLATRLRAERIDAHA
ncbi:SGNH/GDSL hydrolase family protein [Pseudomonas sp. GCEP-101]|uniref:SGNH/GDSL hydrolase family protein n=1 Tax=Pseudomonas sp. GCEP-101 TaxID=2974552 RepID=UPI00223B9309|nr:SGNH/GDSL hydrolase family protein [Pseudomonas sp. GCEP-101]